MTAPQVNKKVTRDNALDGQAAVGKAMVTLFESLKTPDIDERNAATGEALKELHSAYTNFEEIIDRCNASIKASRNRKQ